MGRGRRAGGPVTASPWAGRMTLHQDVVFGVEPINALDDLEREWRCLEREAAPSFFLSWDWIGTLLDVVPQDVKLRLLRGTAAGQTVALAVLGNVDVRRRHLIHARRWVLNATGNPAFDSIYIEHNGLLARPAVGWEGVLEAFTAAGGVDELSLPGVAAPPTGPVVDEHRLLHEETPESSFSVELAALSAADGDVAVLLSSNARSQLRRTMRKLEPVRIEQATTESEALAFFRTLKALHIPWWERRGLPHAFVEPFFERFHQRLIERSFAGGAIQLSQIWSGDRMLGVLYNFHRDGRVYAYQSGFVQPDGNERPGVIAHALAIKRAWQEGAEVYDFMAGENRLKRSFANRTETLSWVVIQKPRLRFRAEHRARRLRTAYSAAHRPDGE
jgi:CelD/BcsL family acetyltransferase involved in cellulose biosynthesis